MLRGTNPYDQAFYADVSRMARDSAKAIVPIVVELVQPTSVIDVGCGTGTWLTAFVEQGVTTYLGIDGDYVPRDALSIDASHFVAADLRRPVSVGHTTYDLAVSLEVAEHLPEEAGDVFVDSLTRLAPVVLFSAAIPGQGGVDHINERWQDYWAERFALRRFVPLDAIRPRVWDNEKVAWFYAQNTLLYAHEDAVAASDRLRKEVESRERLLLNVVHPRPYLALGEEADRRSSQAEYFSRNRHLSFSIVVRMIPGLLARALSRRVRRALSRVTGRHTEEPS